jgi:hypothetical protein
MNGYQRTIVLCLALAFMAVCTSVVCPALREVYGGKPPPSADGRHGSAEKNNKGGTPNEKGARKERGEEKEDRTKVGK